MVDGSFLGISTNGWLAIAAVAYAAATFALAWATHKASTRAFAGAREAAGIQARALSISNNRQQWINAVRDEVTAFLSDIDHCNVIAEMPFSDRREQELLRIDRSLRAHVFKVRLLLNPTEGESRTLVEMMQSVLRTAAMNDDEREKIVSHTQGILKTEWKRVKTGE